MRRFINFGVRFTESEGQALSRIAEHEGLSKGAAVRRLVLCEARQLGLIPRSAAKHSSYHREDTGMKG